MLKKILTLVFLSSTVLSTCHADEECREPKKKINYELYSKDKSKSYVKAKIKNYKNNRLMEMNLNFTRLQERWDQEIISYQFPQMEALINSFLNLNPVIKEEFKRQFPAFVNKDSWISIPTPRMTKNLDIMDLLRNIGPSLEADDFVLSQMREQRNLNGSFPALDAMEAAYDRSVVTHYHSILKNLHSLNEVNTYKQYIRERVSGEQNRCWLRASWRVILEEAFHNERFYKRVVEKIEGSIGEIADAEKWLGIIRRLKAQAKNRLEIMNTREYDDLLSTYGRALVYHLIPADANILRCNRDGNFLQTRAFFEYFNLNVAVMSESGGKLSMVGKMLTNVDKDTVFTDRYVLDGVPAHWNLLRKD